MRNIIRRIFSTSAVNDSGTYQTVQSEMLGQTRKISVIVPYGLLSSAPSGSDGIALQIMGQEENLICVLQDVVNRTKNLSEGETGLENTKTSVKILLDKNGDVIISGAGTIKLESNTEITGDADVSNDITSGNDINAGNDVSASNNVNATANVEGATYSVGGAPGASGTFISADGTPKTITVVNGLVVSII